MGPSGKKCGHALILANARALRCGTLARLFLKSLYMSLLTAKNLQLQIGLQVLLDRAELVIEPGERVCLLGRNGEGKSTLLRVLAGEVAVDGGELQLESGLRVAQLPQTVPSGLRGSVFEVVADGLGELGHTLAEYHRIAQSADADLERMGQLQSVIDAHDGWNLDSRVSEVLSRLDLPAETEFEALSGGLKRRVLLARALITEPDLLLLDEPTNHLDVESITWLEDFLLQWNGTLLFITHDRAFLRRLATRIIELDRGRLTSWPGDYETYLRRKQEALDAEAEANAQFDKKLAQEEIWIRKGIQARRTRNEGRVRALLQLRETHRQRRQRQGTANVVIQEAERSGKLVAEIEDLSFAWEGKPIVQGLSTTILRGDRIGIIGPNGAGKSTLLNLLLGKLHPDAGEVKHGTRLQVAYFDQLRDTLDEDKAVYENIAEGRDHVEINGANKHVLGYLQEFLFTPERARSPVRSLSGGERSRLLLARLFTQPCNLLVLDEPTNDLDLETLDLLEERLADFGGTLFLVSHDRDFLDRVVTRSLVFEAPGRIGDYVGGYQDWLRQRPVPVVAKASKPVAKPKPAPVKPSPAKTGSLSRDERKELGRLPGQLEKLEVRQAELSAELAAPELYREDPKRAQALQRELAELEAQISTTFERWEWLESQA